MLDADLLSRRVRELGQLKALYLSGGEPFEHAQLVRIAEALVAHANEVSIYSSGAMLGATGVEPLAEALIRQISRSISRVDISLYSLSPDEHDAVTGVKGSLDVSLQSIRNLRLYGVPFGIHFVPVHTAGAMLQVAQFAREAGAKRFHVLAVARQGRASALRADNSEALMYALQLLARAKLGLEVILSSQLRQQIGVASTARDTLRPAFLDVNGHVYANEGARGPAQRSLQTVNDSRVAELLADLA
jgi:MoaA/NifB/PqqE/SkfB family radical SAM enzyme